MSLAVIDPLVATKAMVARLATDVVYFDQFACTSPQWIFVKGRPGEAAFEAFCAQFAAAFARQALAIPRHTLDCAETYQIQLDRTRILLEGGSLRHDAAHAMDRGGGETAPCTGGGCQSLCADHAF